MNNHLKVGSYKAIHREKEITVNLNSEEFEKFIQDLDSFEFDVGVIPPGFEHRADLISNLFYDTPTLDWLICWSNNVSDPFNQLNVGDRIKIPRLV